MAETEAGQEQAGAPKKPGEAAPAVLTLTADRKKLKLEVHDAAGRMLAGARAAGVHAPDGPWWSTICDTRGTPSDMLHTERGTAVEAMIEAATGLAADPRAVAGGVAHVERPPKKTEDRKK